MNIEFTLALIVTLVGALLAVTRENILHAVFGLAIALVGVAGFFFALNSPFVAIMEILIYVGGIAVTMIFAVMLSSVAHPKEREGKGRRILAALAAGSFLAAGALLIANANFGAGKQLPESSWGLREVGASLLTRYNLAFETLSIILLLAIIGAIVIVRKDPVLPADNAGAKDANVSASSAKEAS